MKRNRNLKIEQVAEWIELYNSGLTVLKIARQLKASKHVVSRELKKHLTLRGGNIKNTHDDFIRQISINRKSGCWEWTGSLNNHGYGVFACKPHRFAHRYSYDHYNGKINGLFVCHKCDNPKCANPAHLFLGTAKDNSRDMIEKGRRVAVQRKLNDSEVRSARIMRIEQGLTYNRIAAKFNISERTIRDAIKRRHYKNVI